MATSDSLVEQPDLFLQCLRLVAGHFGCSASATVLTAGLPLKNGRLTEALIPKAAERAGLRLLRKRVSIPKLIPLEVPAILLLRNSEPIVLIGSDKGQGYHVFYPSNGTLDSISADMLEESYAGWALIFKPIYRSPLQSESRSQPTRSGSWFWSVARNYSRSYRAVILAAIIINVVGLATPLFIMNVYDRVIPNKAIETLWVFTAGLSTAFILDFLMKISRAQIVDRVGRKIDIQVACNLIEKILATTLTDRPSSTGALVNRIQEYEAIREFFSSNTLMLFVDMAFFLLISAVIFLLAGWVVLVPLTALAIVLVLSLLLQSRLSEVVRKAQDEAALRHSILVESIAGIETIKSIRAEGHVLGRWEKFAKAAAESSEDAKYLTSLALNATGFIQQMVTVFVVVFSVYQFIEGRMSMGAIIATVMLSNRMVAPLSQIAMTFARVHFVRHAFSHLDDVMSKTDERVNSSGFVNRKIVDGSIAFRDVEFSYPGATSPVLKDLRLSISPGERIGIIGRIGSGKTTLGRLLTGLYSPTQGEILLDGVDVRQYHPHEVRRAINLIVQDADLFQGSVRENIVMANPAATDEDIIRAANLAGVDEFVSQHPHGYSMPTGERGNLLSGGQRQCISLARAFLGNPKVLFLDEPSSSMDLQSERKLIERLAQSVRQDQTLIVATHRQSMLQLVDRLIVLDRGKIVRDGPRDDILRGLIQGKQK